MSRPWMPFYVGDYLADTGHLSTTQHGAYILLILHYWRQGGLPDDDVKLARIAKLSVKNWTELIKPDIQPLFLDGWRHKRIDKELAKQDVITTKRSIAGQKGGTVSGAARTTAKWQRLSKHASTEANAKQMSSKRVATTTTYLPCLESERAEKPQEAADEERKPRQVSQLSRLEIEATFPRRKIPA